MSTCRCECGRGLEGRRASTLYALAECRKDAYVKRQQEARERARNPSKDGKARRVDLRIPYSRVAAQIGPDAARELLTDHQRRALQERQAA